jgi:phosphate-selective porin OprO and OprP
MNFKQRSIVVATVGAIAFGFGFNAKADSTDDLINALIAKGVLTEEEGALMEKVASSKKNQK